MRVAFFTHYADLYGANRSLLSLIEGAAPMGVQSHVILPCDGELADVLKGKDIPYEIVRFRNWLAESTRGRIRRLAATALSIPVLAKIIADWKIDLVHTNSSVTPAGFITAKLTRTPHVWHVREFGWLDYKVKPDWGNTLFKYALKKSDAIVAISKSIQEYLDGLDISSKYTIYNGILTEQELLELKNECMPRVRRTGRPFTFAMVGLLRPEKGQEVAIRALADLKAQGHEAVLNVAGSAYKDDYLTYLKRLCRKLKVEQEVTFLGFVDDPHRVYADADATLVCSENEAMGRVTVEAMAAQRPVIGRDRMGTAEIIEHGINGLLYDGSAEELAACMVEMMDNPAEAARMGRNGWRRVKRCFTVERYTAQVLKVWHDVRRKREHSSLEEKWQ